MSNWDRDVDIIQTAFRDVRLPTKCAWNISVLLLKGHGEFRGIGLVKILYEELLGLVNCQIEAEANFHEVIHGFQAEQGTGTTSLEAKLLQNLTKIR